MGSRDGQVMSTGSGSLGRRAARSAQLVGFVLLLLGSLIATLPGNAGATGSPAALTNSAGNVSLTPVDPDPVGGAVTPGTPYSSGQTIALDVTANSQFTGSNETANGLAPGSPLKIYECSDADGQTGDMPTSDFDCDGNTIETVTSYSTSTGAFSTQYVVYALPDSTSLYESPSSTPVCGATSTQQCVLVITTNITNWNGPHLFSAPFSVQPNGDDGSENPGDGTPLPCAAGPSSATLVASQTTGVVADGTESSTLTATFSGAVASGTAGVCAGQTVTLSQGGGSSVISVGGTPTDSTTTDANGEAVFDVTDEAATPSTITYTVTDASVTQTATVGFVAPVPTVSGSQDSSVVASPTSVPADGTTTSTVTVTVRDQAEDAMAGETVVLSQGAGKSSAIEVNGSPSDSATTDSEGHAVFTVTDTVDEQVAYTATAGGTALTGASATVTFGGLAVSPTRSTVVADPGVAKVCSGVLQCSAGNYGSTVTVTLYASDGVSTVSGKEVSLDASSASGDALIAVGGVAADTATTDANGQAVFSVSDPRAEVVSLGAKDVTDDLSLTPPAVPSITFEKPVASPGASTVTVPAATATAPPTANGGDAVTVTVTLKDQFGGLMAGEKVSLTGSAGSSSEVDPIQVVSCSGSASCVPAGVTNAGGVAEFEVLDEVAETVTYTATDTTNGVAVTQKASVTFVPGPANAGSSDLGANPVHVPADGKTASTVTVTVRDYYSNAIADLKICLAAQGGSSVISTPTPTGACPAGQGFGQGEATTNRQGEATFHVTDAVNEVVTYTAMDMTDALPLTGQGVAVTFGTPPAVPASVGDSDLVVSAAGAPADGSSAVTVTVQLADASGNPVAGKLVALNPEGGTSVITTVTGTSDQEGDATFRVTDATAQTVVYQATDLTDHLVVGLPVRVVFTAAGAVQSTTTTPTTAVSTSGSSSGASATSDEGGTGSGGGAGSGATASGSSLAFTGASPLLPWLFALGFSFLLAGTLARRRLATVRA